MDILSKKLKDIILENPHAAGILEKNRLDFCCKGNRTLGEACEQQNLNGLKISEDLIHLNEEKIEARDFNQWELPQLLHYVINTHHNYIKEQTPLILSHVKKIAAVHGERHPELHQLYNLTLVLLSELHDHLLKEEEILFPLINSLLEEHDVKKEKPVFGSMTNPIHMMEQEHLDAGDLLGQIYEITNGYNPPRDACTTYKLAFNELKVFEEMLHEHVHLENYLIFPKALKLEQSKWA